MFAPKKFLVLLLAVGLLHNFSYAMNDSKEAKEHATTEKASDEKKKILIVINLLHTFYQICNDPSKKDTCKFSLDQILKGLDSPMIEKLKNAIDHNDQFRKKERKFLIRAVDAFFNGYVLVSTNDFSGSSSSSSSLLSSSSSSSSSSTSSLPNQNQTVSLSKPIEFIFDYLKKTYDEEQITSLSFQKI